MTTKTQPHKENHKSKKHVDRIQHNLQSDEYNLVNSKHDELNGKILERFGVVGSQT